jgi:hypothetical protein
MRSGNLLIAAIMVMVIAVLCTANAHAQWLDDWMFRRQVTVTNGCVDALTNYQIKVLLGSSFVYSRARADGGDIRFTLADGETTVPYWIDGWNPGAAAGLCYVNIPSLPAGVTSLFLYYGNPTAASAASGIATFDIFDGFEDYAVGVVPARGNINPGEWSRYAGNPILTEGPSGAWDDHGATFATVIYDSAAVEFRMYYHGFSFTGVHQIGLATSPDGKNWTKYAGNPIVTPGPGAWDGSSVRVPMVWKEGPTDYRMIYTGSGSGGMQVGYATSTNGINWTKNPANPVFNDPTWAHGATENWGVMKVGSEYLMWYSNFGKRESGIAVSTDLVTWAPYQAAPIFASSGVPSDDRYSQFCPFSFKYGSYYYVLVPSYNSGGNYSKDYLYRSSSPYFPVSDRHLVRIAHTTGATGSWDYEDNDTPCVFTLDIERSKFYNNQLWCYVAGEGGSDMWKVGLLVENDLAVALADAPLPGDNYTWAASGDVAVVDTPARHGVRSARLRDASASAAIQLTASFAGREKGRVGAWMRRTSTTVGDCDIYLNSGSTLACVAGLGRNGDFHYWNGAFQPTAVAWAVNAWYLVTIAYNTATDRYDFSVYNESLAEIVHMNNVAFGNASGSIDKAMLYTSSGYVGDLFVDDFRVMKWCGANESVAVGAEQDPTIATMLQTSAVSFTGSCVELTWELSACDADASFEVHRAEGTSEAFGAISGAAVIRDGLRFTVRDFSYEPGATYRYRVNVIDDLGERVLFESDAVETPAAAFTLRQNHPNPFNPTTTIEYYVPARCPVTLEVFDTAGRRIARLVNDVQEAGWHSAEWTGRDDLGTMVASGVYFSSVRAGKEILTKKMVLLR